MDTIPTTTESMAKRGKLSSLLVLSQLANHICGYLFCKSAITCLTGLDLITVRSDLIHYLILPFTFTDFEGLSQP